MAIELIGKTAPIPVEIRKTADDGFRKIELYMREDFLDDRHVKFLADAKREFGMKFYSIHTPHSEPDNFIDVMGRTRDFAKKAGIPVIVVHSSHVNVFSKNVLDNLSGKMFPENGYMTPLPFLEKFLKRGLKICLDVGHLYVASVTSGRDYYEDLETIFKKYGKNIGHVHIADVSEGFAGKKNLKETDCYDTNVGDGQIDFFKVMSILSKYYKGVAVVEVDADRQLSDMEKLQKILSQFPRRRTVSKVSRRRRRA